VFASTATRPATPTTLGAAPRSATARVVLASRIPPVHSQLRRNFYWLALNDQDPPRLLMADLYLKNLGDATAKSLRVRLISFEDWSWKVISVHSAEVKQIRRNESVILLEALVPEEILSMQAGSTGSSMHDELLMYVDFGSDFISSNVLFPPEPSIDPANIRIKFDLNQRSGAAIAVL
jgi:hypothetical protein